MLFTLENFSVKMTRKINLFQNSFFIFKDCLNVT